MSYPVTALRHRVLDLNPRVHLDEINLLRSGVVEEFDRWLALSMPTARPTARAASRIVFRHGAVGRFGAGASSNDFLMPPLNRAIAFEEVHEPAVAIADELHLDVLGAFDEFFEEERRRRRTRRRPRAAPNRVRPPACRPYGRRACRGRRRPSTPSRSPGSRASRPAPWPRESRTPRCRCRRARARWLRARSAAPVTLSPSFSRISARGPTNAIPAAAHARANSAFSDRKP